MIHDAADLRRPAHSTLLGRDIAIVEHLCGLERRPDTGVRFFAVPVKVRRFGTVPVLAFAAIRAASLRREARSAPRPPG